MLMRISKLLITSLLGTFLLFGSCKKDDTPIINPTLPNFIIDTDVDIDDAMAILFLLQHSEITVDAITISGTGMSYIDKATQNVMGLLTLAGQTDIPVTFGDTVAINSQNTELRPDSWLIQSGNMMGIELPVSTNEPLQTTAVDFLTYYLNTTDEPVRFIVLGPLTNLGQLLQKNPGLAEKIESIYIMGGALNVPGNLQSGGVDNNPYAEWNIFLDPHAAEIVLNSGINVTIVPLDATNKAPVTQAFIDRFKDDHNTPEANFVYKMISAMKETYASLYFWDPLAAAIATNNSIAEQQSYKIKVITEEGSQNGRTKIDNDSGSDIAVCESTYQQDFEILFINVLNGRQ